MEYDVGRAWKDNDYDFYEVCVFDFEDAFHLLTIKGEGRGPMVARGLTGWALFHRRCCGTTAVLSIWRRAGP
eukprot:5335131-Lingulodinium_polyedra.AAC.1